MTDDKRHPFGGGRRADARRRAFAVAVAALGLFGVLAPLAYLRQPLHVDESTFLVVGREVADGAVLYVDLVDHKPPAVFYVAAALSRLPVELYVAARLLVGLVHLASAALVFALGRRLHTEWTGLLAAGGYLAGAYAPHFDGYFYLTEPFCALALLTATFALFDGRRGSNVLAGAALGVGVLFNQTTFLAGLVVVAFAALRLLRPARRTREYLRRTAREFGAVGVGFAVPFGGTLLAFAGMNALADLFRFAFLVPLFYYEPPFVLRSHLIAGASLFPVWLFAVGAAVVVFHRFAAARLDDERPLFFAVWLVVLGYPGATSFHGDHKLLFALPAAALLAAYGATAVARPSVRRRVLDRTGGDRRAAVVVGLLVALAVLAPAVGVNAVIASLVADDDVQRQVESAEAVDERVEGEAYTLPFRNDVVYFAEGVEPANTFLATPYARTLSNRVIADLEADETPYVLVAEEHANEDGSISRGRGFFSEHRDEVAEYVSANYEPTGTAGGYVVYERTDDVADASADAEDSRNASSY